MTGHDFAPSRPGWAAYNTLDDTQRPASTPSKGLPAAGPNASWLAGLVPSSYHQAVLPVHNDDHRPPALLRRLRKYLLRHLPFFAGPTRPARRNPLLYSRVLPPSDSSWPALPSGDALRFILLCALWYSSSALSSNTGKVILNQFRYPVTLTFIQFGFVAAFCLLFMSPAVQFSKLRAPTRAIIRDTLPMGFFQVGGHIFSSMAISRIPVSTVHTIKALSPLFTVAAYALLFGVSYSPQTYLSLLPLTVGVMLACSFDVSASNMTGLLCAFGSALVFVSQNIFFKKIMPSPSAHSHGGSPNKLDKLNLLFYSSSMAFVLMVPIWGYYDLPNLLSSSAGHIAHPAHPGPAHTSIVPYLLTNGTVHFLQNVLAFVLLARTSPVTYSIASLIKRVAVICAAVLWFSQRVHMVQAVGIAMTFGGLYMYNKAVKKGDVDRGERKVRRVERAWGGELPQTKDEVDSDTELVAVHPVQVQAQQVYARPQAHPPPPRGPPAPAYSQTHAHPNLHIQIVPAPPQPRPNGSAKLEERVVSPTESYPSPPPSLDSPPATSAVLQSPWSAQAPPKKRRGTVSERAQRKLEYDSPPGFVDVPRTTLVAA